VSIAGLNHAVLYVRDAKRTAAFYIDNLDFTIAYEVPNGAFLRAPDSQNDHDLALFGIGSRAGGPTAGQSTVGLYHLAWEVGTLGALQDYARRLAAVGAVVGATDHHTTKGVYAKDPDGLEFELTWVVPPELLAPEPAVMRALNLESEIARYGADTPGARTRRLPA
jgi:catechol-2,3-dioxygenase